MHTGFDNIFGEGPTPTPSVLGAIGEDEEVSIYLSFHIQFYITYFLNIHVFFKLSFQRQHNSILQYWFY